jgi:CMP-N-acetylneuraminic acid synthetase
MSVLAVIPARMGSVRLPRKNLLEIEPGLTLVQQAVNCAIGCGLVDEIVVSTDETLMPVRSAHIRVRPAELCGPSSDIAHAVRDAWQTASYRHDWVVTLQPAVLARSPLILRTMLNHCMNWPGCSAISMAHTVPWIWQHEGMGDAAAPWLEDGVYPRSQDSADHYAEVNAITVAPAAAVAAGCRWSLPLAIATLPSWAVALDVDTPSDMVTARGLWPWAKLELETWVPAMRTIERIDGLAGAA